MLNVNPQTVCFIITRAKEFQSDETSVTSDDVPVQDSEWPDEALQAHGTDTSYREIKAVVDDLEPDQQAALVALMWLGRGDYDADDWDTAYAEAADNLTPRTAEYLLATPLVAEYLAEGLALLGYDCED